MPIWKSSAAAAILLALVTVVPASAQPAVDAATVDPIDAELSRCLASKDGESTAGMLVCLDAAYAAWDKELNTTYQALFKSLDSKSRGLLKRAQRQWVAYRDAERKFWQAPWTADRGTLINVTLDQANVDLVKSRVLALRSYSNP